MKINKLFIEVPCIVFLIGNAFGGEWLTSILGYKLKLLLDFVFFLAIISSFFLGEYKFNIPKKSPLNYSLYFFGLMLIVLSLFRYNFIRPPFYSHIPPIIAYIFFLSVGMVIGCYWVMQSSVRKARKENQRILTELDEKLEDIKYMKNRKRSL